ncbi:hypothetical protein F5Y16DRAFT_159809 [Xylariaceae sp. FL0255]|nr:hypothetical protein F5Y16DRAFT_159809 [Xylariaceae sp. FL0255]
MTKRKNNQRGARSQPSRTAKGAHHQSQSHTSSAGGVQKATQPPGPSRAKGTSTRGGKRKNMKDLEKKIKAQDQNTAWAEQLMLLGLGPHDDLAMDELANSPVHSPLTPKFKPRSNRRGKKFMDDEPELSDDEADSQQRWDRWIPNIEYRERLTQRPRGVNRILWNSYVQLDEHIYRLSRSEAQLQSLPLLNDVHLYQDENGPKPVTPPGFQWDSDRNLIPIKKEGDTIL